MLKIDATGTSLRGRLVRGSIWNLLAFSLNQGSTLIVNILLARILGQLIFGEYAIIQNTLITAATFAELSLGFTATKYIAELRMTQRERAGRIVALGIRVSLALGSVAAVIIALFSPQLAELFFKAPHLAVPLALGAPYLLFQTMNGFQIGTLAGLEAFTRLARAGAVSGFFSLLLISVGGWQWGLQGALIGLSAAGLVRWSIHRLMLIRALREQEIPTAAKHAWAERVIFSRFTIPAAIAAYMTVFSTWFGNFTLVRLEEGFAMMALYAASTQFRLLVLFTPNVIGQVGLTLLSNQAGMGESGRYRKVFYTNLLVMVGVTALAAALFVLLRGPLLTLFGDTFTTGGSVMVLLMLSTVFEATRGGLIKHLHSTGRMWRFLFGVVLPRDLVFFAGIFTLLKPYGAVGLAASYLASRFVEMIFASIQVAMVGPAPGSSEVPLSMSPRRSRVDRCLRLE